GADVVVRLIFRAGLQMGYRMPFRRSVGTAQDGNHVGIARQHPATELVHPVDGSEGPQTCVIEIGVGEHLRAKQLRGKQAFQKAADHGGSPRRKMTVLVRRHRSSYLRRVRRRYSRTCACVSAAVHTSKAACSCRSLARSIRSRASARRACLVMRYTGGGISASCLAVSPARARRLSGATTSSTSPAVSASWGGRVRPV